MNEILAKKYTKALLNRTDSDEFYNNLLTLCSAYKVEKCKEILNSYEVRKEQKLAFLLSLLEKPSKNFTNFLHILVLNQRINLIPFITEELSRQRALQKQIHTGKVYSQTALSSEQILNLEQRLASEFKVSIKLENEISANEGIKIALEELGYEIAFSMQRLKNKMSEFILKTI